MTAVFSEEGTLPLQREMLIKLAMRGQRAGMEVFSRVVGMGSSGQVEGFILVMISSISWGVMSEKEVKVEDVDGGGGVGRGGERTGDEDMRALILFILFLKNLMKLLHCDSDASIGD